MFLLLFPTEVSCFSVTGAWVLFVAGVGACGWVTGIADCLGSPPQWELEFLPVFHTFTYMKWEHKNFSTLENLTLCRRIYPDWHYFISKNKSSCFQVINHLPCQSIFMHNCVLLAR